MNIIGHSQIIDFFEHVISKNKLAHAYLFQGPSGVGKMTVVNWLINRISMSQDSDKKSSEIDIQKPHHDIIKINRQEGKKEIAISDIRDMQRHLFRTSFELPYKIVIIENAEYLSMPAANALLKTIEEPSGNSLIFLTSSRPFSVIDTISSRCQHIYLNQVPIKKLAEALGERGIENAESIARISQGLPGRALRIAGSADLYSQYLESAKNLAEMLRESVANKVKYVGERFPSGKTLMEHNEKASEFLFTLKKITRDMLLLKTGVSGTITYAELDDVYKKQDVTVSQLVGFHRSIIKTEKLIKQNANVRLALENLLISI